MIWESTALMTGIDVAIISLAFGSLWVLYKHKIQLDKSGSFLGFTIIGVGLLVVGLFYLTDLFVMHGLTALSGKPRAMEVMVDLHLNYSWLVILVGVGSVFLGFAITNKKHSLLIEKLETAEQALKMDIKDRKQVEEALRKSEERYRSLYDDTPSMYFTLDSNAKVLSVNKFGAQLLGYHVEELVGKSVLEIFHNDDIPKVQEQFMQCLENPEKVAHWEFRKVHKDGTVMWVKELARVTQDTNSRTVILIVCEDITDRKLAEEALQQSEKQLRQAQKMEAIGTLAGGIAHDFNNILGAMLGYAELSLARKSSDSQIGIYLKEILKAGKRAKNLVKQILAFSHPGEQERHAVDLGMIVNESLQLLRATLPSSIQIRHHIKADPAIIYADPTQIHQVMMNLGGNAEYAMREKSGVLEVELTSVEITEAMLPGLPELANGSYLQLTIRDAGCGMSSHVLDRIFEPFFTTKGPGEGTGMGLAVVHGIIAGHEGAIRVKSTVGTGSVFEIFLPKLETALPVEDQGDVTLPKGKGSVLFVDDEESLVQWGQHLLTNLGYKVVGRTRPENALELFREAPSQFDIVITDQTMPTMSGEAFARALQNIRQDIPIVLCTGFSHTMTSEKAKSTGIRAFLMKPVTGRELASTIQEVLGACPRLD